MCLYLFLFFIGAGKLRGYFLWLHVDGRFITLLVTVNFSLPFLSGELEGKYYRMPFSLVLN